jgi:hypothetical protein
MALMMPKVKAFVTTVCYNYLVIIRAIVGIGLGLTVVYPVFEFLEWRTTRRGKNLERIFVGIHVVSLVVYGLVGVGWVKF